MLHLQPSNYNVNHNNQLCVRTEGALDFVVVFYHSPNCNHCTTLLPAFIQAQATIQGCTFAATDLSDPLSTAIRRTALRTTTPLNKVPQIIMYFREIPISEFRFVSPDNFVVELRNWIMAVASDVNNKVRNNDLVFSTEGTTCIGDRCELSIPSSKPVAKRYQKL